MTSFVDGPAKGRTLMLQRAPIFLRVVQNQKLGEEFGKWDALDLLSDTVEPEETPYVYVLNEKPGMCHVNRGSKGGGFYSMARYRILEEQPGDAILRDNEMWRSWTSIQTLPENLKQS